MSGATDFNGELFQAEHLAIEDELSSRYINKRREFGARIKEFAVNEVQSHHSKHRQAISLTPRWRLSISLNDEPENLLILPPIDESMRDKLMLLRAFKRPMPMPTNTVSERKAFWETIKSELPGFLYFLDRWEIPNDLKCDRFGIKTHQHPELLLAIDELSPEFRVLQLLDTRFDTHAEDHARFPFIGTASEFEEALKSDIRTRAEATALLGFHGAMGTYLGRLAIRMPGRVDRLSRRGDVGNRWALKAPAGRSAISETVTADSRNNGEIKCNKGTDCRPQNFSEPVSPSHIGLPWATVPSPTDSIRHG